MLDMTGLGRICVTCYMALEFGEGNLPESLEGATYIGHSYECDDECHEDSSEHDYCHQRNQDYCDYCDGESSPNWFCSGCGDSPGMFYDTFLVRFAPSVLTLCKN